MEETSSQVEIQRTKSLFSKYIAEVLARLEQYKDDLLAACLHLVLSSPTALTDSNSVVSPIQLALKLGLGYFPLASVGLEAIERWMVVVDKDSENWFRQVLPNLNEYLMVQVPGSATGDGAQEPSRKVKLSVKGDKSSTYISILKNSSAAVSISECYSINLRITSVMIVLTHTPRVIYEYRPPSKFSHYRNCSCESFTSSVNKPSTTS